MILKPLGATAISVEASDEQLVVRAQAGDSEAFAVLFRRYRPAIARYAGRILNDNGRAEDIVQEVFLSALRSIGRLDRPAGFKPWLYRIAHNTCVDHIRRSGRAEEVSIDANLLPASEEIRLFRQAPSTHTAVTQKEDFKNLREAFGGLPPAQSEVLVLRELEGLSYDEIAARMGVTRASVESMLFRARQGLRVEYGQIATGERCLRMRQVMARMAEGISGVRDKHALARHVRGCQPCRRDAFAMGLEGPALESPVTGLRGGLSRVAALLPLPWLIHRRGEETSAASSAGGGGTSLATQAQTAISQLSSTMGVGADQAATAIHKAVAVVAAVAVVGGGGIVASKNRADSDLLLKRDRVTVPARGDSFGAKLPAGLVPLSQREAIGAIGAPALAAVPGTPGDAAALTAPALDPAPVGAPGALETPVAPDAGVAPTQPDSTGQGGESPGSSAPDSTSGADTTLPAAGDTGTPTGDTGGLDAGAGGGGGSSTGGDTGGGASDPTTGSGGSSGGGAGVPDGTDPPAACEPPKGLEKKDRVPPGHARKCAAALEAAAAAPAP